MLSLFSVRRLNGLTGFIGAEWRGALFIDLLLNRGMREGLAEGRLFLEPLGSEGDEDRGCETHSSERTEKFGEEGRIIAVAARVINAVDSKQNTR